MLVKKIGVYNGKPCPCAGMSCCKCDLDNSNQDRYSDNCEYALTQWYLAEHIEKPTLTKQERAFLEICKPECYIARDKNKVLWIYSAKPIKGKMAWEYDEGDACIMEKLIKFILTVDINKIFHFIKWEDEEPWKVEDLLKLEVK